jgi:hypothetical protein
MKRCYHCKRFIWPWQSRWLGLTPAHKTCDMREFEKSLRNMSRNKDYIARQMKFRLRQYL